MNNATVVVAVMNISHVLEEMQQQQQQQQQQPKMIAKKPFLRKG
jgi:hypothetical protein